MHQKIIYFESSNLEERAPGSTLLQVAEATSLQIVALKISNEIASVFLNKSLKGGPEKLGSG